MALIVLDASALIGHLDPADAHHRAATEALASYAFDDLHLPASAYAEALVGPVRKNRLEVARKQIAALLLTIDPLTKAMAERAAALRATHAGLRLPDALVLACAEELGADRVLTADHRWAAWSDRVRTIG